jgi:hypothetical protein
LGPDEPDSTAARFCLEWNEEMPLTTLTREEVVAALGSVDDHWVAEILATGASSEEFAAAWAWVTNDEAPMNTGAPLASGRVAQLIELLEAADGSLGEEEPPLRD